MIGSQFFQDKDHGWSVYNNKLTKTFTVIDADQFINDIRKLGSIFQYDADRLDKLDANTVKVSLIIEDPQEISSRDLGLANAINMIGRNQEELRDFTEEQREQVLVSMLSDHGLPTRRSFLTFEQKTLLAQLVGKLEKAGRDTDILLLKQAQLQPDTQTVGSPEVNIAPMLKGEIEEALNRIKNNIDPNYFKNVSRIDVLMGGPYGQVSSDDPAVVKVNLSKVKEEVKRQLDQRFKQDDVQFEQSNADHQEVFDEVLTRALIEVVAHEKGHVEDFQPKVGPEGQFLGGDFPGGEAPAESEAARVKQVTDTKHPLPI